MTILDRWIESAETVPAWKLRDISSNYLDRLNIDRRAVDKYQPKHPALDGDVYNSINWTRLLPSDTISRIKNANDLDDEFRSITSDTYKNMESSIENELNLQFDITEQSQRTDISPKSGQLAYINNIITTLFRGDTNIWKLRQGKHKIPTEPKQNPPDHVQIRVERRNERNMVDAAFYEIDNPSDFFGSRYGSSTLMLEGMAEAEIEPEAVIHDCAFDTEGASWGKSEPPEFPISYSSTDHRMRSQFWKVNNPKRHYGNAWGDIQKMVEINNSEQGRDRLEYLGEWGSGWTISLGM